ncbi:GMC oxidoreductase [Actinomadura geliboluensis]|uniref:Cholesterol oxidase n=1 Tax=Actinomadura geliboluensis TaxID=882440 RepID=A0A5S4H146_9ACTN|nr:GMC family oxidoreductase [Actinomadura geliboluensis]TMR38779.1 GMC family oxidoreductase [Actinomadura geliboluensis]
MPDDAYDFDVIVVGSGFGGSVSALRLAEKGYRVAVIEAGRRFDEDTLPKTSWRLRKYVWAPRLGMRGIQRVHLVGGKAGVLVLAGAGVGGGSLVYANTLYVPPEPFFKDRQWGHITDWQDELNPYYDQARRMLGVTVNPLVTPADEAMKRVAERMGVADTYHPTPVGVFFGEKGGEDADDPYFGGAGPRRTTCTGCGFCMIGCKVGAKNMLTKNYLYLAEKAGVQVVPDTTVTSLAPRASGGYEVGTEHTGPLRKRRRTLTAEHVVLAAGTYGTQRLLHRMRAAGRLPGLSLKDWAKRTVIALVMQTADNSITIGEKRGRLGRRRLVARQGDGEPNPTWIPIAHDAVRKLAEELDATPGGTWFDLFNIPTTAHFIGGCVIGETAEDGVIDPYHRVHGYPGLHIVDGSAVTANLGVNPSLTITAQAERAMAFWPNRGDKDPRPEPGTPYQRVDRVMPASPAVPPGAPAALRTS